MKNVNRLWTVPLAGLILLLGLAACSSTQTVGEEVTDAWITSKVTGKLTADPEVNPFEIDVDTQNGVVRLSGSVETEAQRNEAEELARGTEGVERVINDIQLGDPTFGETIDDAWISTKVKSKLAADPEVNAFNIDVDVQQSVVTLSGTVKTERAQQHAAEIARDTDGVRDVRNLIKVEQ